MKKKRILKKNNENERLFLVSIMMLCVIVAMITYWYYAYNHKEKYSDDKITSQKISDYVFINGNIVKLNLTDEKINDSFISKQKQVIDNNDIIDIDVQRELNDNILSIKITYTLKDGDEKTLIINVDIKESRILSNDELLIKVGSSYKKMAEKIFDSYIRLADNYEDEVIDAISEQVLNKEEFNKDREKYIIRIREKLPDIVDVYVMEDKLFTEIDLNEIYAVCYKNINQNNSYIKLEIGKI